MKQKKRTSELKGSPIEAMKQIARTRSDLHSYFYFDSRCWRRIQDHIWKAKDCVLVDRPGKDDVGTAKIVGDASGPSIRLEGFHTYSDSYDEQNQACQAMHFCMEIAIDCCIKQEFGDDIEFTRKYDLKVPIELEDDCDDVEFEKRWQKWLTQMTQERDKKMENKDLPLLERLIKKYPVSAGVYLNRWSEEEKPS